MTAAPGAEDNASGCAGVLELARVLTTHPPEGTVLFICYAGEEQGLLGSEDHVADLVASGDASKVQAMLDLDMIAYTADGDLDCLLESEAFAQFLVDLLADAAAQYSTLRIEISLDAWGSDHVPYLDQGIPALLAIENDWYQYPYYHTTDDLPYHLSVTMGEEVLKMSVAALAELADARTTYVFADGFETGDLSLWSAGQPN
jgi:Zn-dependent M28 family amino/carboxypeptidase